MKVTTSNRAALGTRALLTTLLFLVPVLHSSIAVPAVGQADQPSKTAIATDVKAAIEKLDTIGGPKLRGWRFRLGDLEGGAAVDLDDSGWRRVSPQHRWRGANKNAWYRRTVTIPEKLAGFAVAGTTVSIRVGVDDYGEIWVDGKKRNEFEWNAGEVVLAEKAEPGRRYVVAILAKNRGGPGRLMRATLHCSALEKLDGRTERYRDALKIGVEIVKHFGGEERKGDTALRASIAALDFAALDAGDADAFAASVDRALTALRPLRELTRGYKVHAVGYSHIDLAWLWRWEESVQVTKETFQAAIDFFKEFPDFRFSQSQSHAYRWMEKRYPDLFAAIQEEVKAGRWEIVGGTNVELDCNLPGAESHIRQLLYGRRYFMEKFGKDVRIGWCPDSFGYNVNLPQILKKAGVDYFVTAKISWNDTNDFPHNCFWWEAPDGSRVLAFLPMGGYTFNMDGKKLLGHIKQLESQAGLKKVMSVYGVGNHGGGPTRDEIKRAKALKESEFFPDLEFSTALEYFESITAEEQAKLPVWKDELYLEYHRGTYTTHAAVKKANRHGECGLGAAEKLAAIAMHDPARSARPGQGYPSKRLGAAWDILLFNQMHDILPGSSITPVYRDTKRDYRKMFAAIRRVKRDSLGNIASRVTPAENAATEPYEMVTVFNPLNWVRGGLVSIPWTKGAPAHVVRGDGGPVLYDVHTDHDGENALRILAGAVPPIGYRTFRIYPKTVPPPKLPPAVEFRNVRASGLVIENEHLRVDVNPKTGGIKSIIHKVTGMEAGAVNEELNVLQLHEDRPKQYDAWNLRFTGKSWKPETKSVKLIEATPLRAIIRVEQTFLGESKARRHPTENFPSSFFTMDLILERSSPILKVRFRADWWEEHLCLKVAFPMGQPPDHCVYDAPNAHILRSTKRETDWDKARYEVSGQYWADMSKDRFGVAILNDSKYGYDALGHVLRLTLLRSPTSPDPTADRGRHEAMYAIYPHYEEWRKGRTVNAGWEFNHPMIVDRRRVDARSKGTLPAGGMSYVSADANNIVITTVKKHEDSDAWIVRLFEWKGTEKTPATLTFARDVKAASIIDLNEKKKVRALEVDGKNVRIDITKYATETLLIEW